MHVPNEKLNNNKLRKKCQVVPWTLQQKEETQKYFKNHIEHNKVPKRNGCEDLKKKFF